MTIKNRFYKNKRPFDVEAKYYLHDSLFLETAPSKTMMMNEKIAIKLYITAAMNLLLAEKKSLFTSDKFKIPIRGPQILTISCASLFVIIVFIGC